MRWNELICLAPLLLAGCEVEANSPRGFVLPDGDVSAGQTAFTELHCSRCHTVEGTELATDGDERAIHVTLGGEVRRVRTYGELVTAIINPSHDLARGHEPDAVSKDGKSFMADYNQEMTVQQMIDLVAFLQSTYIEYLPEEFEPYMPLGQLPR